MATIETLDEPIKVRADFTGGIITPLAFKRKGQTLTVDAVNARWEERRSHVKIYFFSVEAAGNVYELHLDSGCMGWRLDRVCLDG
jgi:hypothetical protein